MSARVPDVPPKPVAPILTIGDHIAAGLEVTSYCSTGKHRHVLDLQALGDRYGMDRELDYHFALDQKCPECGAPGGGMQIAQSNHQK